MQQQQQTHKESSFLNISIQANNNVDKYIFLSFNLYILPTTTTLPKSYYCGTITIALKLHIQGNSRSLSFNYGRQETLCSFFS